MVTIIPPASIFNKIYIPEIQNKQQQFEDYVETTLFPKSDYSPLKLSGELEKRFHLPTQPALRPNFYLKDKLTGDKFLVECKYRAGCIANSFQLAQSLTLTHSVKQNQTPYFFILGIGGTPGNPAQVFLINQRQCAYLVLYKRHLKGKQIDDLQKIPSAALWL